MMNEKDLKEGMAFLRNSAFKEGLYFKLVGVKWIYPLSIALSESNNCKKFWKNVSIQHYIHRILRCEKLQDIFFGTDKYLFSWSNTKEGWLYWNNVADSLIAKYDYDKLLEEL